LKQDKIDFEKTNNVPIFKAHEVIKSITYILNGESKVIDNVITEGDNKSLPNIPQCDFLFKIIHDNYKYVSFEFEKESFTAFADKVKELYKTKSISKFDKLHLSFVCFTDKVKFYGCGNDSQVDTVDYGTYQLKSITDTNDFSLTLKGQHFKLFYPILSAKLRMMFQSETVYITVNDWNGIDFLHCTTFI
jgi:hypothetical protein